MHPLPGDVMFAVTKKDVREPASSYYASFTLPAPAKCNAAGAQLALDVASYLIYS